MAHTDSTNSILILNRILLLCDEKDTKFTN